MLKKFSWVMLIISLLILITLIANFLFNKIIKNKVTKRNETIWLLVISVVKYSGLIISIFIILTIFGVDTASVLAGAGFFGILIGFGMQKLFQDMINGFFIIFDNQYVVGEYIEIDNKVGEVIEMGLRTTKILSYEGEFHYISNGDIKSITNFSRYPSTAIIDIPIYHENEYKVVKESIEKVIKEYKHINLLKKPKLLGVQNIEELFYTVRIVFVTKSYEYFSVIRDFKTAVMIQLSKDNIKFSSIVIHPYLYNAHTRV